MRLGRGRVVAVAVDDQHVAAPARLRGEQCVEHLLEVLRSTAARMLRRPILPLARRRRSCAASSPPRRRCAPLRAFPRRGAGRGSASAKSCSAPCVRQSSAGRAGLQRIEHRLLRRRMSRAASSDSSSSASRPLTITLRHILAAEAAPNLLGEHLRAGEPELPRQRQEVRRVRAAEQHRRGDAMRRDRRHDRGFDESATRRRRCRLRPPASRRRHGIEIEEIRVALQMRAPRTCAAAPICAAVTALITRSASATAPARIGRREHVRAARPRARRARGIRELEVPCRDAAPRARADRRRASARLRRTRAGQIRATHARLQTRRARTPRRA